MASVAVVSRRLRIGDGTEEWCVKIMKVPAGGHGNCKFNDKPRDGFKKGMTSFDLHFKIHTLAAV